MSLAPASLLQLLWLASPALPIGGFSYSEGLEAAIEQGLVRDETSAGDWLLQQLRLVQARGELVLTARALPVWRALAAAEGPASEPLQARLTALNDWVLQTRESAELRLQCEQMGHSLRQWLLQHEGLGDAARALSLRWPQPSYPLMMALALSLSDAPPAEALLAQGFGWAENLVQAALKAVPLGQSAGQRVLARLVAALPPVVEEALQRAAADEPQVFAPMLAILSARHEAQYSRLFRS